MTSWIWEVSSSIRCDWIWRGSRVFVWLPPRAAVPVVSVPVRHPVPHLGMGSHATTRGNPVRQQPLGLSCIATRVAQSLLVSFPCAGWEWEIWRIGMFSVVSLEVTATPLSWAGCSSHLRCDPSLFCMFREGPSSAMGCAMRSEGTNICGKISTRQGCNPSLPQVPSETLPRLPSIGLPQQWGRSSLLKDPLDLEGT